METDRDLRLDHVQRGDLETPSLKWHALSKASPCSAGLQEPCERGGRDLLRVRGDGGDQGNSIFQT